MTKSKKDKQIPSVEAEKSRLPLLAEVEELNFQEAYARLVGSDGGDNELYLGFANAL